MPSVKSYKLTFSTLFINTIEECLLLKPPILTLTTSFIKTIILIWIANATHNNKDQKLVVNLAFNFFGGCWQNEDSKSYSKFYQIFKQNY